MNSATFFFGGGGVWKPVRAWCRTSICSCKIAMAGLSSGKSPAFRGRVGGGAERGDGFPFPGRVGGGAKRAAASPFPGRVGGGA